MNNLTSLKEYNTENQNGAQCMAKDAIFIKEGHDFHKVKFDDIIYLSSEHVYVTIHTSKKKFLVRACLTEYLEKFDPAKFVRVHRRYVVNFDKVEKIHTGHVIVNNEEIPVSKTFHHLLLSRLNLG